MELKAGDKVRFKNMPITYPYAKVLWTEGNSLGYELEIPLTRLGYEKTEMNDVFHVSFNEKNSKANTVSEGTCTFDDVERI